MINSKIKTPINLFVLFCFPVFFLALAEAIMSYVFPIVVESSTGSNTVTGIILSLSSIVGLLMDFALPQLLKGRGWRFQVIAAIITVGLKRFPISFWITSTGLVPPCSDPTTGDKSAKKTSPRLTFKFSSSAYESLHHMFRFILNM